MNKLPPSVVRDAHGYTRSEEPWILGEYRSPYGKLIHYLCGGGMKVLGRTIGQELARRRHRRFYAAAGIVGALWLLFYFV